jgi:hypothetical protein
MLSLIEDVYGQYQACPNIFVMSAPKLMIKFETETVGMSERKQCCPL